MSTQEASDTVAEPHLQKEEPQVPATKRVSIGARVLVDGVWHCVPPRYAEKKIRIWRTRSGGYLGELAEPTDDPRDADPRNQTFLLRALPGV